MQFFALARRAEVRAQEQNSSAAVVLSKVKFEELKALGIQQCIKSRRAQVPVHGRVCHCLCVPVRTQIVNPVVQVVMPVWALVCIHL